jgi:hypothetical protein
MSGAYSIMVSVIPDNKEQTLKKERVYNLRTIEVYNAV